MVDKYPQMVGALEATRTRGYQSGGGVGMSPMPMPLSAVNRVPVNEGAIDRLINKFEEFIIKYGQEQENVSEIVDIIETIRDFPERLNAEIKKLENGADGLAEDLSSLDEEAIKTVDEMADLTNEINNSKTGFSNFASLLSNLGFDALADITNKTGELIGSYKSFMAVDPEKFNQMSTFAQIGAMSGVVSPAVGLFASVAGLFTGAGEKQISAAEKMEQAAQSIRDAFEGKGFGAKVQILESEAGIDLGKILDVSNFIELYGDKLKEIKDLEAEEPSNLSGFIDWAKELGNEIENLEDSLSQYGIESLDDLAATLEGISTLMEGLGIDWLSIAQGAESAFDEIDLDSFNKKFKQGIMESTKSGLITSFLTTVMEPKFKAISDRIWSAVVGEGMQGAISEATVEEIEALVDGASAEVETFYSIINQIFSKFEDTEVDFSGMFAAFDAFAESGKMLDATQAFGESLRQQGIEAVQDIFAEAELLASFTPLLFNEDAVKTAVDEISKSDMTVEEKFRAGAQLYADTITDIETATRALGFDVTATDVTDYPTGTATIGEWGAATTGEAVQITYNVEVVVQGNVIGVDNLIDEVIDGIDERTSGDLA